MHAVLLKSFFLWIIQVYYVVDKPSSDWRGGSGYITKDMVLKGMPAPSDDTLILVSCSSIAFAESACDSVMALTCAQGLSAD